MKFQMFQADKMYQKDPGLYKTAAGKDVSIFSLVQSMEMPAEWISPLLDYCREKQVIFLSTVCDEGSADLLQSTSPSAFKIASYEINHLPLLKYVARMNRPMIFSTAGAEISDIHEAWSTIRQRATIKLPLCIVWRNTLRRRSTATSASFRCLPPLILRR